MGSNTTLGKLQATTEWPRFLLQVFAEHFPSDGDYEQQLTIVVASVFAPSHAVDYYHIFSALRKWESATTNCLERALRDGPQWYFGRCSPDKAIVSSVDFCRKLCGVRSSREATACSKHFSFQKNRSLSGYMIIAFLKEAARQTFPVVADFCYGMAGSLNPYVHIHFSQLKSVLLILQKSQRLHEEAGEFFDELLRRCPERTNKEPWKSLPRDFATVALTREESTVSRSHFANILVDLYLNGCSSSYNHLIHKLKDPPTRRASSWQSSTVPSERHTLDHTPDSARQHGGPFASHRRECFTEATLDLRYLGALKTVQPSTTKRVAAKSMPTSASRADFLRRCYQTATAGVNRPDGQKAGIPV
ncbi:hypothetical protein BV898_09460 [Hypsibius exemplaris]|uniref:Uncharacterized protein n=1 Tax=Hypsibius exemplaris TaxID=2072580 RepID=A0A1W0WMM4_HYPEX|nr:hypothetical protein BV898_09460 [Hypsibius exemplaris]